MFLKMWPKNNILAFNLRIDLKKERFYLHFYNNGEEVAIMMKYHEVVASFLFQGNQTEREYLVLKLKRPPMVSKVGWNKTHTKCYYSRTPSFLKE